MVLRIALIVCFCLVFLGASSPSKVSGVFSVTVGLKKKLEHEFTGEELAQELTQRLLQFTMPDARISIARIYITTREVILNVRVDDVARLSTIRSSLIAFLATSPDVSFAGTPEKLRTVQAQTE